MEVTPDRSFMKDLKTLSSRLGIKFNGFNFVLTYERGHGEPANVLLVKDDNGGFRQPDRRDIEALRKGDLNNYRMKDHLDRMASIYTEIQEKMQAKAKDDIRGMTKDNKRQLVNAFARATNDRKANATFRRVDLKRKGKTIEELRSA
jgi:hypothetical protein